MRVATTSNVSLMPGIARRAGTGFAMRRSPARPARKIVAIVRNHSAAMEPATTAKPVKPVLPTVVPVQVRNAVMEFVSQGKRKPAVPRTVNAQWDATKVGSATGGVTPLVTTPRVVTTAGTVSAP